VLLAGRAVLDDPHRRRRLRLCPQRLRAWGGFLTGTAILIEYAIAPAAIAVFIGAYCQSLFGIGGWMIYLAFYIIFIGIHIFGVGEALKLMFIITAIAAIALAVFLIGMVPHFDAANLFDIAKTDAVGASSSCRSAMSACGPRSLMRSGSSSPSKACPWPPKKPRTRNATCRAA
jgi:amino acid transporter